MAVRLTKRYIAKVYTSAGAYIGMLPQLAADPSYNQNIMTTFAQMELTVQQNEPDAKTVGGNIIRVWEFSTYYPNGIKIFDGYISKWKTVIGTDENIVLTCISQGQDLSQYVVEAGDTAYITQNTDDGSTFNAGPFGGGATNVIMQTFTVAANTVIGGVTVEISTAVGDAAQLYVAIRSTTGTPAPGSDPTIMSGTVNLAGGLNKVQQKVTFNAPSTLNTGTTYYIIVEWSGSQVMPVYASSANPYANGTVWQANGVNFFNTATQNSGYDLWFTIWQHGGSIIGTYTSVDPSYMLTDIMNNYISRGGLIQIPGNPITPLFTLPFTDGNVPGAFWGCAFAQTFTPATNQTINIVQLDLGTTSGTIFGIQVALCKGNPALDQVNVISGSESYTFGGSNVQLATTNFRNVTSTAANILGLSFSTPQNLTAGQQYYFLIQFGQGGFGNLVFKGGTSSDTPASPWGNMYYALQTFNNGSTGMTFHSTTPTFFINLGYVNPVPANLDSGFANTGVTTTYTFKQQTMLQAIQAIANLAPFDWYWYVDPATSTLVFKESSATADVKLIKGRHINELPMESTIENIINVVYFTGGDNGAGTSTNVSVKKTNAIGSNRVGLAQISDNRVSGTGGTAVGGTIAQDFINQHQSATYITDVVVQDETMDTSLLVLGKMVGYEGFGDYVDALVLQIVGRQKQPDQVTLQVGTLPVRQSLEVQQIVSNLAYLQTVNNPSTPS